MFCSQCGQPLNPEDQFCRRCGAATPAAASAQAQSTGPSATQAAEETTANGAAYTRADYNPQQPQSVPPTGYSAGVPFEKKGTTLSIVLSVINILFFGFGISTILGIIALIYTIMAINTTDSRSFRTKMTAAKGLNWFGLAMVVLQFVIVGGLIIAAINVIGG